MKRARPPPFGSCKLLVRLTGVTLIQTLSELKTLVFMQLSISLSGETLCFSFASVATYPHLIFHVSLHL